MKKTSGRSLDISFANKVVEIVANHYGVSVDDILKNRRRYRAISDPRGMAVSVIYNRTNATLDSIAEYFGRDHTWICYWANKSRELYENDSEWRRRACGLAEKLENI